MKNNHLIRWPRDPQQHAAFARQFLRYDPTTGKLYWIVNRYRVFAGQEAGNLMPSGYIQIVLAQKNHKAHRLAWLIYYGCWPNGELDHINHNPADNRLCNLRIVDRQGQSRNASLRKDNSSKHVGVSFCKSRKKWAARIKDGPNGRYLYLGRFDSIDAAIEARKIASQRLGYHSNHGAMKK